MTTPTQVMGPPTARASQDHERGQQVQLVPVAQVQAQVPSLATLAQTSIAQVSAGPQVASDDGYASNSSAVERNTSLESFKSAVSQSPPPSPRNSSSSRAPSQRVSASSRASVVSSSSRRSESPNPRRSPRKPTKPLGWYSELHDFDKEY